MTKEVKIGDIVEAEVTRITDFGAFVKINGGNRGLIHISQISDSFVKDINEHLNVGTKVKARVIKLGPDKKIDLSLKRPSTAPAQKDNFGPPAALRSRRTGFKSSDFEEKLKRFLKGSQQSLANLKEHDERYRK